MPAASNAMRTILRTGSVVFQFSRVNPSALNPEFDLAAIAVAGNSGPSGPYRATSSQWATQSARAISASSNPLAKKVSMFLPNLVATSRGFWVTDFSRKSMCLIFSDTKAVTRMPVSQRSARIALSRFCCGVELGISTRACLAWIMLGAGRGGAARASASSRRDRLE